MFWQIISNTFLKESAKLNPLALSAGELFLSQTFSIRTWSNRSMLLANSDQTSVSLFRYSRKLNFIKFSWKKNFYRKCCSVCQENNFKLKISLQLTLHGFSWTCLSEDEKIELWSLLKRRNLLLAQDQMKFKLLIFAEGRN